MSLQEGLLPKVVPVLQLLLALLTGIPKSAQEQGWSDPTHPITLDKAGDGLWLNQPRADWWAALRWICWFGSKSSSTKPHTGPRKGRTPLFHAGLSYFPQDLGEDGATFFHSPAEAAKRARGGYKRRFYQPFTDCPLQSTDSKSVRDALGLYFLINAQIKVVVL